MLTDPALWARLETLALDDPGAACPFSVRLAEENGWTRPFARRVIDEYKRFVYLSQLGTGMVTPSTAVDRAWHLHLAYTRHYWDVLCARVLGRPLHHEPGRGEPGEVARFGACYRRTLALYRAEFGEEPPAELWPRADAPTPPRAAATHIRRSVRAGAVALALLLGFIPFAFAASEVTEGILAVSGGALGALILGGIVFAWRAERKQRSRRGRSGDTGGGGGCGGTTDSGDGDGGSSCGGGGD